MSATPGPWHTDGDAVWAGTASPGICMTVMPPEGVHFVAQPDEIRRANARLIAAAPELLAVLKEWLDGEPGRVAFGALMERSRAVIASIDPEGHRR